MVLRGLVADWPVVASGRESAEGLAAYLKRYATPKPVSVIAGRPEIEGRFFYNADMTGLNFSQLHAPLAAFLDRLLVEARSDQPNAIAAQSLIIPETLPGLETANAIDLVDAEVHPRLWIGGRSRVSAHYDLMENVGCVVAGRRRFTLFPPDQIGNLYVGPFELTPAGTPVSMVDANAPDLERYPRFADAWETAQSATLEPGDAIYIPYHWWHGVDSLEPVNTLVNYWWNPATRETGNPYDVLIHAMMGLGTLPPDQRAAWRAVFDHYVFKTGGDPATHLPPHAQGPMGPPTPQSLARMRNTLKQIFARL